MFGLLWRSALGASAHDPGWHPKFPYSLKDSEDDDFVYLFYEEDRLFARSALRGKIPYSLRRAFGWYNIELDGERIKLLRARVIGVNGAPGTVLDDEFTVACGDAAIRPITVQRAGRPAMSAAEFLRGNPVAVGTVLR